jgi:hypothetical protein
MDQPLSRRAWIATVLTGATSLAAAACQPSAATVLDTPEGRILQWEGDDLLVLVSGLEPSYQLGDVIRLTLMVNNQSTRLAQVRLRPKLLGRADQPVVQPEPAQLTIGADDAASQEVELPLGRSLLPGDYALIVEVPPWKLDGRETGRGTTIRAPVRIDPAG